MVGMTDWQDGELKDCKQRRWLSSGPGRGAFQEPSCGTKIEGRFRLTLLRACSPAAFEIVAGSSYEAGSPWPPPPTTFASWEPPSSLFCKVMVRLPPGCIGSVYLQEQVTMVWRGAR